MSHGARDYYFWDMPISVPNGGTGCTSLTLNGVLIGQGGNGIFVTAAGTPNQVLRVPGGGGTPIFSSLGALADKSAVALATADVSGVLPVANGGTGTNAPALAAGVGISLAGTWPAQTITCTSAYAALADPLPVGHGGTGTATPALAQGVGITITGAWPGQTITNNSAYAALADPLPVAHGGTGSAGPALVAGANISLSGSWPAQTVAVVNSPTLTSLTLTSVGTNITFGYAFPSAGHVTMDKLGNIFYPADTTSGSNWYVVNKNGVIVLSVAVDGTDNVVLNKALGVASGGTSASVCTTGQMLVATGVDAAAWQTPDGARVYNSGNETIGSGAWMVLTFNSERYNNGPMHSTSVNPSRLTAQHAGVFSITGNVEFAANSTGNRGIAIRINGGTYIASQVVGAVATDPTQVAVATLFHLAVGDYVELVCYQTSGGNLLAVADADISPEFAAQWVGP